MSDEEEPRLTPPVSDRDHRRGPDGASVTLVEYGDFECSVCGEAYPRLKQLQAEFAGDLQFVFRNFPLTQSHPYAQAAAEAAEAAGAQGKFWEMHDLLFEHQNALTADDLRQYAAALDLDLPRFDREIAEGRFLPRIREDVASGVRSGVNGTPTLYINGQRFNGPPVMELLRMAIEAARE